MLAQGVTTCIALDSHLLRWRSTSMQMLPAACTTNHATACTASAYLKNPRSHLAEAGFNLHAAAARCLHHCLHGDRVSDSVPAGVLGMHPLLLQQLVDLLAAAYH